jgi:hypothetical protein
MAQLHSVPQAPGLDDPLEAAGQHNHVVQFYDSDEFLGARVVSFLRVGVREREPVVLIATADHCGLFTGRLSASGIDLEAARRAGSLTILEARETLAKFMVGGMPDWHRFKTIASARWPRAPPRASVLMARWSTCSGGTATRRPPSGWKSSGTT